MASFNEILGVVEEKVWRVKGAHAMQPILEISDVDYIFLSVDCNFY